MREPGANEDLLPIILVRRKLFMYQNNETENRVQWIIGMTRCKVSVRRVFVKTMS